MFLVMNGGWFVVGLCMMYRERIHDDEDLADVAQHLFYVTTASSLFFQFLATPNIGFAPSLSLPSTEFAPSSPS
jgi:hypothetical protein